MENKFIKTSKLYLEASEKEGKTILSEVSFTAPFKIMRPFYEEEKGMSVMILTASAGIMEGDEQRLDFQVRKGAEMEVLSQSYEKIHRMEKGYASRKTRIRQEAESRLTYRPLPAIPFRDSDFRSEMEVHLADETSVFIFSEVLTCGRAAYGERFSYRRFQNLISIYQAGKIVYRDNTCYEPDGMDMEGFGMYEGFTHLANLLICNLSKSQEWIRRVRELLDETQDMEGGVTTTAAGHYVVKILGKSGEALTGKMEEILELVE